MCCTINLIDPIFGVDSCQDQYFAMFSTTFYFISGLSKSNHYLVPSNIWCWKYSRPIQQVFGSEALLIFRREQVSLFFQSVNDCCNLLMYGSCTIYVAKFVCCLPANDPEKKHTSPLISSTCLNWLFSFRNYLWSIWIALWSARIVFWVCLDWVVVCKDCVLEIVGPRPPVIQLSTDIRGSWIKGGSRAFSFCTYIMFFFVMSIYNAMILLVGYLGSLLLP